MSPADRVVKQFYPNGQLQSEITYLNGDGRRWITKHWHPNGVLESEIPVVSGCCEGTARFWNDKGELLGSYEMHEGSGVQKAWHQNGAPMGEITWVEGQWCGRQRSYWEGGELIGESYWIHGREVSKKKYLAASLKNPSLPRYEQVPNAGKSKRKAKNSTLPAIHPEREQNSFIAKMLSAAGTREVLEWLGSGPTGSRTLGELPTQEASLEWAEEIYALGALKVWAVEIDTDDPDLEGTGKLIVTLPKAKAARARILEWCGELAQQSGYDPESDVGQDHIFVMLD